MAQERWFYLAFLAALTASVIPVLGRLGLKEVDSTLAAVLRGVVMAIVLLIFGTAVGVWSRLSTLRVHTPDGAARTSRAALLLIALTGLAGAASWLFYFKALKLAEANKVAAVDKLSVPLAAVLAVLVLGERPRWINWLGIVLVAVGAYLASLPSKPPAA